MKSFVEQPPFWFALGFSAIVMQLLGLVVVVIGRVIGIPQTPLMAFVAAATTIVPPTSSGGWVGGKIQV